MKLLLCEDEIELSNALCAVLKHNNYTVEAVYDGEQALDYLENDAYDAVIMDIMMPKLNGIEVLKRYRAGNGTAPVILLTAKSEIDDKVRGLDAGADDYLAKPFSTKELLARLRSISRRKQEYMGNELKYKNLILNRATYEMSTEKGIQRLANKEFQMLELLMSSPKQLISTEQFMEKIWGLNSDAEINVVWVYISSMRKKLLALSADVQIKAARGVGYYLEDANG